MGNILGTETILHAHGELNRVAVAVLPQVLGSKTFIVPNSSAWAFCGCKEETPSRIFEGGGRDEGAVVGPSVEAHRGFDRGGPCTQLDIAGVRVKICRVHVPFCLLKFEKKRRRMDALVEIGS